MPASPLLADRFVPQRFDHCLLPDRGARDGASQRADQSARQAALSRLPRSGHGRDPTTRFRANTWAPPPVPMSLGVCK